MKGSPPAHEIRLWDFQAVRDALVILILIALIWLGSVLSMVTMPLLIGLGLAYLIEPVVVRLARWRWINRLRAVLIILATVVLLSGTIIFFTVPPLVRQGMALADSAGVYADSAHAWLNHPDRPAWLHDKVKVIDEALAKAGWKPKANAAKAESAPAVIPAPVASPSPSPNTTFDEAHIRKLVREEMAAVSVVDHPAEGESMGESLLADTRTVCVGLAAVAGGMFGVVVGVSIAATAMVSFSLSWPALLAAGRELIPLAERDRILGLISRMDRTVSAFVRGRFIVATIVGCLYAIGWMIVGVPYGLILGLIVGVLSLVPYLAAIGLPVAWILLALQLISHPDPNSWYLAVAGGSTDIVWWKVLLFPLIVNFIVQVIEDYVLNPLIQGNATEMHPAAIIVAVIAGGSLAGLYGMILAVPIAACAKILITAELLPRFKRWANRPVPKQESPSVYDPIPDSRQVLGDRGDVHARCDGGTGQGRNDQRTGLARNWPVVGADALHRR